MSQLMSQNVAIDLKNDWDRLAEVAIASHPEGNAHLDSLALLLESHGTTVHRVVAPRSLSQKPNGTHTEQANQICLPSLFPQNSALVYSSRVIEVPPQVTQSAFESGDVAAGNTFSGSIVDDSECRDALFRTLEKAGVEVIRWPGASRTETESGLQAGKLVDVEDAPNDQDSPRLCPSDVVILSPTLLITRLSSFTNNKGLEYLWSVLSHPVKPQTHGHPSMSTSSYIPHSPFFHNRTPSPTTLLVSVTDPDAPSPVHSIHFPSPQKAFSPRSQTFPYNVQLTSPSPYTPLSRALVPLDARIMLYDPALIPDSEVRRLKSILDRLQEFSQHDSGEMMEASPLSHVPKRDSIASYGTFGSFDPSGDGWEFISVDSLHLTSLLMVSSTLALVSVISPHDQTTVAPTDPDPLASVSQVLDSLGIQAVQIPPPSTCGGNMGIRDAVMVLRRTSETASLEDAQQQPEEENQDGCMETTMGLLTALCCGFLTVNPTMLVFRMVATEGGRLFM